MQANWRPFVFIQACAFVVVILYHNVPAVARLCESAGAFKASGGYLFSALSTAFASVLLPQVARGFTGAHERLAGREATFRVLFFMTIGVIIDAFYRGLAVAVGPGTDVATVSAKVLIDQFIFSPLGSLPLSAITFLWRDSGFRWAPTVDAIRQGAFLPRYLPLVIGCWAYWGPTLVAVFAMPSRLQFVLFLFAQAAWSLLLVHVSRAERTIAPTTDRT